MRAPYDGKDTMRPLPVLIVCVTLAKLAVLTALYSLRLSPADPGPLKDD
ncbi:hypothetical protein [Herbiconiux sp. A18JL235]|uniref:Uncharacterized protein n=1 Tax=Herbiconiux sp. A18JL235 TaxID=3152363 RepID=A0AB39BL29_9MICO